MSVSKEAAFGEALQRGWGGIPPWLKASVGALGANALYHHAVGKHVERGLANKFEQDLETHKNREPVLLKDVKGSEDLVEMVKRFKKDHPGTASVPVYASGRVPSSAYIPKHLFAFKGMRDVLKRAYGITEPGVYVKEKDAAIALHEMGHAELDRKFPKINLIAHGISAAALPLLAWAIFKKPGATPHFIEKYSPLIALGMQLPVLAEEAAASIIAKKSLKSEGDSKRLLPGFMGHAMRLSRVPVAAAAAMYLKRK